MPGMSSSALGSTASRFQLAGGALCLLTILWKVPYVLSSPHAPPPMGLQSLKIYFALSVIEPEAEDTQLHRTDLT